MCKWLYLEQWRNDDWQTRITIIKELTVEYNNYIFYMKLFRLEFKLVGQISAQVNNESWKLY